MARERMRQPSLPEVFSEVLGDFADLFRKELRLNDLACRRAPSSLLTPSGCSREQEKA